MWYTYIIKRKQEDLKIRKLAENDGLTLKNGKIIRYKTGWQVATEGVMCYTPQDAVKTYNGNCGVWLENGIYYVDKSHRVNTKKIALEITHRLAYMVGHVETLPIIGSTGRA